MDGAIRQLEVEVSQLQALNKGVGPEKDTANYFLLQAKSFGLSLLRKAKADGLDINDLRQRLRKDLVA